MPIDAHFSGNGGDGIFCSIRSAVPLLDHFLSKGPRTALGKTVRDISSLTGANIVTVLRHAWLRHRRSGGAHLPRYNVLGLEGEMLARIEAQSRSEEHTSELQSLMRISYAVFCLKKKNKKNTKQTKQS